MSVDGVNRFIGFQILNGPLITVGVRSCKGFLYGFFQSLFAAVIAVEQGQGELHVEASHSFPHHGRGGFIRRLPLQVVVLGDGDGGQDTQNDQDGNDLDKGESLFMACLLYTSRCV